MEYIAQAVALKYVIGRLQKCIYLPVATTELVLCICIQYMYAYFYTLTFALHLACQTLGLIH